MRDKREVEEVNADALEVGDEIFFPNSRQPQEITTIMVDQSKPEVHIIYSGEAKWNLPGDHKVRRVKKVEPVAEEQVDGS